MPLASSLLRDLRWKLAAVLAAYILFLIVVEEKQALRQLEVPVRFENHDKGLALLGEHPSSVIVRVRAAEGLVKDLQAPDVDVVIDLTGLGEGRHSVRLLPDSPAISPRRLGVKVVEVFPSRLEVTLEARLTKEIPVQPMVAGEPAEGFEVTSITVTPPTVQVVGPKSAVQATVAAITREIGIANLRAPIEQLVGIDVESPDIMITGRRQVKVTVDIAERMTERVLEGVQVAVLRGDYESSVRPNRVTLTLHGPERLLTRLADDDIVTFVDAKGLAPSPEAYNLRVQVTFTREPYRRRVQMTAISSDNVAVRISDRKVGDGVGSDDHGG